MLSGKQPIEKRADTANAPTLLLTGKLFFLVALVLWPTSVYAQEDTFGTLICNIQINGLGAYPYMLSVICYVIATFLTLRSMLLFKRHADNPTQGSLVPAIAHMVAAALLVVLPGFAGMMVETLFPSIAASGGAVACAPGAVVAGSVSLDAMMENFVKNVHQPIFLLIAVIGYVVGATYIAQALLRGAKSGVDARAADPKLIVSNLIFGALLMAISTALPSILATIFGDGGISDMKTTENIIQWSKITGTSGDTKAASKAISAVLAFIQIVGGIAFLRGWLILKKAVEGGQATIPQGLTHIIAGAMCINMDKMVAILDETFGTDIIT